MDTVAVTVIVLYLVGVTAVGAHMARRSKGSSDWAVAGGGMSGVLVAFACDDHYFIENVAVLPQLRGTGRGRLLLTFAEDEARRQGFDRIEPYTNAAMRENIDRTWVGSGILGAAPPPYARAIVGSSPRRGARPELPPTGRLLGRDSRRTACS